MNERYIYFNNNFLIFIYMMCYTCLLQIFIIIYGILVHIMIELKNLKTIYIPLIHSYLTLTLPYTQILEISQFI